MNANWVIVSRLLFASAAGLALVLIWTRSAEAAGNAEWLVPSSPGLLVAAACVVLAVTARKISTGASCVAGRIGSGLGFVVAFAAVWSVVQHIVIPRGDDVSWGIVYGLAVGGTCLVLVNRARNGDPSASRGLRLTEQAVALSGCLAIGVLLWHANAPVTGATRQAKGNDWAQAWTITLKKTGTVAFSRETSRLLHRIGFESATKTVYAAIDYRDERCRGFRAVLDDVQESFGADLAIVLLPAAGDDEGRAIHRALLTLRKADPAFYSEVESRIVDGRIPATHSAVVEAAVRLVGASRFQAVHRYYHGRIVAALDQVRATIELNDDNGAGVFPRLFAGQKVLVGFDGSPTQVEQHIAEALRIRSLTEVPYRPVLSLRNSTIDLGELLPGQVVPVTIPFENAGNEPLAITLVKGGSGVRVEELPAAPVPPGDDAILGLQVRAGQVGDVLRDVLIGSNDGTGFRRVRLRGHVSTRQSNSQSHAKR